MGSEPEIAKMRVQIEQLLDLSKKWQESSNNWRNEAFVAVKECSRFTARWKKSAKHHRSYRVKEFLSGLSRTVKLCERIARLQLRVRELELNAKS